MAINRKDWFLKRTATGANPNDFCWIIAQATSRPESLQLDHIEVKRSLLTV